jgi:hypothetical protein
MSNITEEIGNLEFLFSLKWNPGSTDFINSLNETINKIARSVFQLPADDKTVRSAPFSYVVLREEESVNYDSVMTVLKNALNEGGIPDDLKENNIQLLIQAWENIPNQLRIVFGNDLPPIVIWPKQPPFYQAGFQKAHEVNLSETLNSLNIPPTLARDLIRETYKSADRLLINKSHNLLFKNRLSEVIKKDPQNAIDIYRHTLIFFDRLLPKNLLPLKWLHLHLYL